MEIFQESPGKPRGLRRERTMNVERWIRVIAGTFVLTSLFLGLYVSRYWFLFTAFVGLNLFQSGLTKWCLMENILKKLGVSER
jgi:uncharacterized membrane protein YozB (DUF420 family)